MRAVRPATTADREAILDVAEAAFVTEPAFHHFFGDDYRRYARTFLAYLLDLRMDSGLVWVEEVDGRVVAASLWNPPGGVQEQDADRAGAMDVHGCTVPAGRGGAAGELRRPRPPARADHARTTTSGSSRPTRRRAVMGTAAAVLRPGLEAADAEGLPVFLETGTEGNLGFYARYGFAVTDEVELEDGTHIWCLTRPSSSLG